MKKLVNVLLIFLIAYPVIGLLVSSCADESDCSTAGRPMLRCIVYSYERKNLDNKKDTIPWLTITALKTDSTLLNSGKEVVYMDLPLRYTTDSTALILHYNEENLKLNTDTIVIWHQNTPNFVSMDCGYEMKQSVNKIIHTTNKIDSIYINNASTNTDGTENLKIFFSNL